MFNIFAPRNATGNNVDVGTPTGFHFHWKQKRLPSVGAHNYAWNTIGLPEGTPVGAGTGVMRPLHETSPGLFVRQTVPFEPPVRGILSGQLINQPLVTTNDMGQ